jgi:hypothetical protein
MIYLTVDKAFIAAKMSQALNRRSPSEISMPESFRLFPHRYQKRGDFQFQDT